MFGEGQKGLLGWRAVTWQDMKSEECESQMIQGLVNQQKLSFVVSDKKLSGERHALTYV